jgi:adenylate cyclase class IV
MSIELKVKAINLADEARTIKRFEQKFLGQARKANCLFYMADNDSERQEELRVRRAKAAAGFEKLRHHRVTVVRKEARATNIARAFIKGLSYDEVERNPHTVPDWIAVTRMINSYGSPELAIRFSEAWGAF